jgi:hypothetical protein
MYFAVDPAQPCVPEQILVRLSQLEEQHPGAEIYCYLLVDVSFDQTLPSIYPWRGAVECSLYEGMRLEGLKEAAPHLFRLRDDPKKRLDWLQQLFAVCTGKPMLSILFSAIPSNNLRGHIQPYLLARTEDSMEWPVRWADTRVLPGLIAALTPEERQHLLSPLFVWMMIDRQGELIEWRGDGNPAPDPADFDCWPLDEGRFSQLLVEAEADAVLSQIDERRADLLANGKHAEKHIRVSRQLALATRYKIDRVADRLHFALLGLMHSSSMFEDPLMRSALGKIEQGGDYREQLDRLPEGFWARYQQGITL